MKTRIKFLSLLSLASAVVFSLGSCSNNDDPGADTGDSKSIFLKLSGAEPDTYAAGAAQGATPVVFTSGHLYFVGSTGTILNYFTVTSNPTDINGGNISLETLKGAGETINNISSSATTVFVVGNTAGLPISGNISTVRSTMLAVESQYPLPGANLYGSAGLTHVSGDLYSCNVTLAPTVARIELTDIRAGGTIESFSVNGIFIDNYYTSAAVDGSVLVGNLISNGSNPLDFFLNSGVYPNRLNLAIYDWYATPQAATGSPLTVAAGSNQVWGYNVFANATGVAVPRIIIRLSNITVTGINPTPYPDPQFLTIKGLKNNGVLLSAIEAGKVYNIGAGGFTFTEDDLDPLPNMNDISVTVKVSLAAWTVVPVTPKL